MKCFLAIFAAALVQSTLTDSCPNYLISTKDILTACLASKYSYTNTAVVGVTIPSTLFKIVYSPTEYIYKEDGTGIKVIIAEYNDTTVIAFRGTKGMTQIIRQIESAFKHLHGRKVTLGIDTVVSINSYFWTGFKDLYEDIKNYLNDETRKYIITGHSLGGAMASILALFGKMKHKVWTHQESCLITFGQPRVGDEVYAKKHDELINTYRKLRFVNDRDPVPELLIPQLPPLMHHSREIWMTYNDSQNLFWTICPPKDTSECSQRELFKPKVSDHHISEYEKKIRNLPSYVRDYASGREYTLWKKALGNSCKSKPVLELYDEL